jgi:hypothetical protein
VLQFKLIYGYESEKFDKRFGRDDGWAGCWMLDKLDRLDRLDKLDKLNDAKISELFLTVKPA